MTDQQFCLRWNNHQSTLISVFDTLLENGTLVDCTLAAEGQYLKAHKVVLSACSPYLETLLSQHYEKHPIVILKDVKFTELKSMMDYMYRGEVNISQDQLGTFLKAAESLQIKGLSENGEGDARDVGSTQGAKPQAARKTPANAATQQQRPEAAESPANRDGSISPTSRKRRRIRRSSDDDNHLDANSCDLPSQAQSTPIVPNIPASITSTPIKPPIVKPEVNDRIMDHNSLPPESGLLKEKIEPAEPLLEPKTEYLEDLNNDDSVEDLTLDDDDEMDMSQMSNMSNISRPGPSHGADLSNQGFAPWQLGNQSGTDEVFMAAQEAVNAQRDSQDEEDEFGCLNCKHMFDSQARLVAHLRQVTANPQRTEHCFVCDFKSNNIDQLSNHLQQKHPEVDTSVTYVCQECEENFRCQEDALCHLKTCEKDTQQKEINAVEILLSEEFKILEGKENYSESVEIKTEPVDEDEDFEDSSDVLAKIVNFFTTKNPDEMKKGFKCPNCKKTYTSYVSAKAHLRIECNKEPENLCHICDYRTKQMTNLRRHIKLVHQRPDKFICEKCGRAFERKASFSHHIRYDCNNGKPHQCHLCDFKTKIPGKLNSHLFKEHNLVVKKELVKGSDIKRYPDPIKLLAGFRCADCMHSFQFLEGYYKHRRQSCGRANTLHCLIKTCHYKTNNNHNMKQHLKRRHYIFSKVKNDQLEVVDHDSDDEDDDVDVDV